MIGYVIDLLAAIPSVVFGLWGGRTLAPVISDFWVWLGGVLDFLPFWTVNVTNTGRSLATASVVLAVMILPIITAVSREVFLQTPKLHEEAALALGATRWEMVRTAVLPFGRSGVISAAMLGLGARARRDHGRADDPVARACSTRSRSSTPASSRPSPRTSRRGSPRPAASR